MSKTNIPELADIAIRSGSNHNNDLLEDVAAEKVFSQRAQFRADQIGLIRAKLATSVDGHLDRAATLLLNSPSGVKGHMPDTEFARFRRSVGAAKDAASLDRELEQLETDYRSHISVVKEVDPYSDGSPNSWIRDTLNATSAGSVTIGRGDDEPGRDDRLQRHGAIVMRSLAKRNKYGRLIEAEVRSHARSLNHHDDERAAANELRTLVTDGGITATAPGGAAAFVTPQVLLESFATYRSPFAGFVSQLNDSIPLPDFGLQAAVPAFSSGTSVTATSEGSPVSESDPSVSLNTVDVNSISGKVTVSQAYLDRAGGPGIGGDAIVFAQLRAQLDANNDTYALTTALANAQAVAGISSFTLAGTSGVGGMYGDLRKARRLLTDTAGVRIRASHFFANDDLLDFAAAWGDAQGRPVAPPAYSPADQPTKAGGDSTGEGYTALTYMGMRAVADSNIPAYGTTNNEQLVVTRPDTILWMASAPIFSTMPSGGVASFLEAYLVVRNYVVCFPLYPQGVAAISGAGYASSTFA